MRNNLKWRKHKYNGENINTKGYNIRSVKGNIEHD